MKQLYEVLHCLSFKIMLNENGIAIPHRHLRESKVVTIYIEGDASYARILANVFITRIL